MNAQLLFNVRTDDVPQCNSCKQSPLLSPLVCLKCLKSFITGAPRPMFFQELHCFTSVIKGTASYWPGYWAFDDLLFKLVACCRAGIITSICSWLIPCRFFYKVNFYCKLHNKLLPGPGVFFAHIVSRISCICAFGINHDGCCANIGAIKRANSSGADSPTPLNRVTFQVAAQFFYGMRFFVSS